MAKNKQRTSLADLIADSALQKDTVLIGDHVVTIQEMTGRQRFSLSEKADDNRWDVLTWVVSCGMVDPSVESVDELEAMNPAWIVKIANAILKLSGMDESASDDAENESAGVSDIGGS